MKLFVVAVAVVCFCFGGDGGESASGAVKGEGGPVSFGVGCETVRRRRRRRRRRLFLFWGGGRAAGGQSALEFGGVVVVFFFGGTGASQLLPFGLPNV